MGFLEELHAHLDRVARGRDGMPIARMKDSSWRDVTAYAREIRATHEVVKDQRRRVRLSVIGKVFLDLKGRDAVRWLLHVELAQSRGRTDPFRLSPETVSTLVRTPEIIEEDCTSPVEALFGIQSNLRA